MPTIESSVESVLRDAEAQLRHVIATSATKGDYATVDMARAAAGRINDMLVALALPEPSSRQDSSEYSQLGSAARSHRGKSYKPRRGEYPKFVVRKDVLQKVAWSKKESQEYIHKTPKMAFDRTIEAIAKLIKSGQSPFTAEQVVELIEQNGGAIPIYQVYVALAFLRHGKAIVREGRDGYVARSEIGGAAQKLWTTIAG